MSDNLVVQLRTYFGSPLLPVSRQAADEIERLNAKNARLREALKQAMDDIPGWYDAARAALAEKEEK